MALYSKWLVEKRVIYTQFRGLLTVDDLKSENEILLKFVQQGGDLLVHHVVDTAELSRFPLNFRVIADVLTFTQEANMGWQVGVGMSPKLQELTRLVSQTARFQLLYAATIEDALQLLRKMDSSLESAIAARKPKQTGVYPTLHLDDD